ncbi:hypothetical protein BCR43DRAFT_497615 [Syncephalastrum racemosum]|uniref:Uncharacterized protein n=1 Tax=Syncephalastrum racemosum TaxID=13706 RepID=A0A1X2H2J0_SYNRA|nr:hypothetical protein BCR43DRAFT_497615 [Syncephalastrum racemosum]
MSRTYVTPLRLFTATDLITGQPKVVLKVSIIGQGATFSFSWRRQNAGQSSSYMDLQKRRRRQTNDVAQLALLPDNIVRNALARWIAEQKVLVSG